MISQRFRLLPLVSVDVAILLRKIKIPARKRCRGICHENPAESVCVCLVSCAAVAVVAAADADAASTPLDRSARFLWGSPPRSPAALPHAPAAWSAAATAASADAAIVSEPRLCTLTF